MKEFTPESLPLAIAKLFELNHHSVEGPVKIHGAEVDLVATPIGNPFGSSIYIEATVEYVNNGKYGKDLTKLAMIREKDPNAVCLIVSSRGFTPDVMERASASRFQLLTYDELFAKFEKFQPYVELCLGESPRATELRGLSEVYERPTFSDTHGRDDALSWLQNWVSDGSAGNSWLLIVGEYGTGKSALTRMLQYEWVKQYRENPDAPIPVRIELGDFTKQLDAQGLLHHFLDHNNLSHVSIDFFWSLIRAGRVVLILDGYDEMAQYLSQRERRVTLKALAELSRDGVRGIITSRPNYFSEAEELSLFDHLYREISIRSKFAAGARDAIAERESEIDNLIQRSILDRFERSLQDLSPDQSRSLVDNILSEFPDAAATVKKILDRVFRSTGDGSEISLSGKPVIISYLIEIANTLNDSDAVKLTEWDVYTLILDKLGLRDLEQTVRVGMDQRRKFLQQLALNMITKGKREVDEDEFRKIVEQEFDAQIKRTPRSDQPAEVEALFEDLRRSGTLTRSSDGSGLGWRFSHNSLREFLAAESLIDDLTEGRALVSTPPVSDAMRAFVASRETEPIDLLSALASSWADSQTNPAIGTYLTLTWDALPAVVEGLPLLGGIAGVPVHAEGVSFGSLALSSSKSSCDYSDATFRDCILLGTSFESAQMPGADFRGSLLDAADFNDADLTKALFDGAVLADVSFVGAKLEGASFLNVDADISFVVETTEGVERLEGKKALGFLSYAGAIVDAVDPFYIWIHHPKFSIVEKISSKIVEGGLRQRRGLQQRGAAAADPKYARAFVKHLESSGIVSTPAGRSDLLEITTAGRSELGPLQSRRGLPKVIIDFLKRN